VSKKQDEGKRVKRKTKVQAKAAKDMKLKDVLLAYFNDKTLSQNEFAQIRGLPRSTSQRHWRDCGLAALKKKKKKTGSGKEDEEQAKFILAKYLEDKTEASNEAREQAQNCAST
jgi:hypothetical protein